jgi:hypothetical protein
MEGDFMHTFIDILWLYFDFFLIAIAIALLTLLLSLFFKKKNTLIAAVTVVVVGGILLLNQMQYTTFSKLVSEQLNDESEIKNITITINDFSNHFKGRKADVTIEDEAIIEGILNDFETLKLKKEINTRFREHKYDIRILTTNLTKMNYYLTDYLTLSVDDDYINNYHIVGQANHLKTIEALIENEDIEWTFYNE